MMPRSARRDLWLVTLLALTAFALRLTDLTARSLWLDESFTLLRVNDSWAHMFTNTVIRQGIHTIDINPPLYFAELKVWTAIAGTSEFSLKAYSAFAAVLIVPLTFVLARRLFGRSTGLSAALLALACGAYQWYAGELRMYAHMACIGALTMYALFRTLQSRQAGWGVVWLGSLALGIFTHYSFIGLALGQGVLVLIALGRNARLGWSLRTSLIAATAVLVAAVAVVAVGGPTLARATRLAGDALTTPKGQGMPPADFLYEVLNALLFGLNAGDPTGGVILLVAGALIVIGVALALRRVALTARMVLAVSVVAPIAFWLILALLIENKPSFRYVIYVFPALHVLMARAVTLTWGYSPRWVGRVTAAGAALLVLGSSIHGTVMALTRTPTYQDDWRSFGLGLRKQWQPGDAVVINLNTPEGVLPYVMGDLAREVTFARDWLMTPLEQARDQLNDHGRIWYANTGGDAGYQNADMQRVFEPYVFKQRNEFAGRTTTLELLEYETRPSVRETLSDGAIAVDDMPRGRVALAGYAIRPGSPVNPNANFIFDAYWQHGDDAGSKHALTLRLKHGDQVWLDWSFDAMLSHSPQTWLDGTLYRQSYIVPVPPGLPAQPYELELLVRSGEKGEVFQHVNQPLSEDALACCVRVRDWPGERWRASDVALAIAEYPQVIKPGEVLPAALTWRATHADTPAWQTELALDAFLGGRVAEVKQDAGATGFPTTAWPVNELARDQLALPRVPYTTQPGWYRLSLNRYRDGSYVDGTLLGIVRVEDYPRTPVATDIQHRVDAKVGELALLGYDARAAWVRGKTLAVYTHWRADVQPRRDGKLFLHVIGPDGRLASQDDGAPFDNTRSTLTLRPGDGVDQLHQIELKPDAIAGTYTLYAGIYDAGGEHARWPAQQDGQAAPNDLIKLGSFTLE